jgi:hypothetical protein
VGDFRSLWRILAAGVGVAALIVAGAGLPRPEAGARLPRCEPPGKTAAAADSLRAAVAWQARANRRYRECMERHGLRLARYVDVPRPADAPAPPHGPAKSEKPPQAGRNFQK